jgi:hypothetical protein
MVRQCDSPTIRQKCGGTHDNRALSGVSEKYENVTPQGLELRTFVALLHDAVQMHQIPTACDSCKGYYELS